MDYSIFYFDEVIIDIKNAKLWYEASSEDLENRFILAIQNTITKIGKFPKAYSIRYKNVRVAYSKVFPYAIHFYIDDVAFKIVIIAILHGRRQQDIAVKRLT